MELVKVNKVSGLVVLNRINNMFPVYRTVTSWFFDMYIKKTIPLIFFDIYTTYTGPVFD